MKLDVDLSTFEVNYKSKCRALLTIIVSGQSSGCCIFRSQDPSGKLLFFIRQGSLPAWDEAGNILFLAGKTKDDDDLVFLSWFISSRRLRFVWC